MGFNLFGSSNKSKSTTNNTTENKDLRVGAAGDGVALGSGASLSLIDPGAIGLAGDVMNVFENISTGFNRGVFDFAEASQDMINVNNERMAQLIDSQANPAGSMLKTAMPLALVAGAIYFFTKG